MRRGTLVSFDSTTWKALVMLDGSLAEVEMAVGEWVPAALLAADDEVAVLLFADHNQEDGVILGPFGDPAPAYFDQLETAAPTTPAGGFLRWFADSTQSWGYFKNDAGKAVPAGVAAHPLPIGGAVLSGASSVFVQTVHPAISFAAGNNETAHWTVPLPHGWAGRSLTLRIVWAPSTTNTGDCRWSFAVYLQKAGTTLSSTQADGDTANVAAGGTADRPQAHTNATPIDLTAFADGDSMSIRVFRNGGNAADTFTGAARLLSVELSVVG